MHVALKFRSWFDQPPAASHEATSSWIPVISKAAHKCCGCSCAGTMPRRALIMQLLLIAAVVSCATGRPPRSAAARIQHKIQQQQSVRLRQLQQTQAVQPLLGLDTKNKKLRVLAFGDSITEGWINSTQTKVPWSPQVQQKLQQRFGSNWSIEVVNGGKRPLCS